MKRVLHIGPGKSGVLPHTFSPLEWEEVRFDLDRITEPHIVGNITDMGMIENETFDAVFSSHTIEHLYPLEVKKALEECLRVLRSDGFLLIVCPDLEAVAAEIVKGNLLGTLYEFPGGSVSAIDILYGHRAHLAAPHYREFMSHRTGFTLPVMLASVRGVGFGAAVGKRRQGCYDLWVYASKKVLTDAEIELLARLKMSG